MLLFNEKRHMNDLRCSLVGFILLLNIIYISSVHIYSVTSYLMIHKNIDIIWNPRWSMGTNINLNVNVMKKNTKERGTPQDFLASEICHTHLLAAPSDNIVSYSLLFIYYLFITAIHFQIYYYLLYVIYPRVINFLLHHCTNIRGEEWLVTVNNWLKIK